MADPFKYYADQAANHPSRAQDFTPPAMVLTLQIVNVLLLLAAVAIVCCWTTQVNTARWYLIAVAFADYGHIYSCYKGAGPDFFWNLGAWNDMMWGNVGMSAFLNVNRWLTVLGLFGKLRATDLSKKNK